jgi:hypothetical protein
VPQACDHDPPAQQKLAPLGIVVLVSGLLSLAFARRETSDFWADGLEHWWTQVRGQHERVRQLVLYLDNGPNNSGVRTQFLKRMVGFVDQSGLAVRLVYYPPYHSKYNPIERCWSALEKKWNGVLLQDREIVLQCAARMRWCGQHPTVRWMEGEYPDGVAVARGQAQRDLEARLERSLSLPKYDILIKPQATGR